LLIILYASGQFNFSASESKVGNKCFSAFAGKRFIKQQILAGGQKKE